MPSKWSFSLPVKLEFGRGYSGSMGRFVSQAAAERGMQSGIPVLLVGYRDCTPLEKAYKTAADSLRAAGFTVDEFLEVVPEPDEEIVRRGAEFARRCRSGIVVGLGGGSAIDAAKVIAALAIEESTLWEHSMANKDSRPVRSALPVVAIPTTAGTGAEATSVAVIKQHGVGIWSATACLSSSVREQSRENAAGQASSGTLFNEPVKTIVYGPALMPMLAVVDADFYDTMPRETATACGADALSHSIEVITSRLANPVSTALAVESVRLLLENLAAAAGRENNLDAKAIKRAREAVTLATLLSGMAVNGPGATAAHAVSHALGAILDIPHGEAVALAALPFLRFNAETCVEEYARLAQACGLESDGRFMVRQDAPYGLAQKFVEGIEELWQTLGLPLRRERCSAAERDALVKRLANNAIDGSPLPLRNNARKVDRATLERILGDIVR